MQHVEQASGAVLAVGDGDARESTAKELHRTTLVQVILAKLSKQLLHPNLWNNQINPPLVPGRMPGGYGWMFKKVRWGCVGIPH